MRIGSVILAGGQSRRMGTAKAALDWHGTTLLTRISRVARRGTCAGPAVVVRARGQVLATLDAGVVLVEDDRDAAGPLAALAVGLLAIAADTDAVIALATDTPFLHPAVVRRVLAGLTADADAAVAVIDGRYHPLAAAYRTGLGARIDALLAGGVSSLTGLREVCAVRLLDADWLLADPAVRAGDPALSSFVNVNGPDDYARALAQPVGVVSVSLVGAGPAGALRVAALSVAQAAAAVGVAVRDISTVVVNDSPVDTVGEYPLAAGDTVRLTPRER
jgi:molybdenum cofactor guanylyltransferase